METSPAETTVPVNEGAATVALAFKDVSNNVLLILPPTNKLLEKETSDNTESLLFMETSPAETTMPANEGATRGALAVNKLVNPVLTMDPPINRLALKDESDATDNLLFIETSPAEIIVPVNEGAARFALNPNPAVTNAVVAN